MNDRIIELALEIADSAARSDIEAYCKPAERAEIDTWYFDRSHEREYSSFVENAIEYLTLRNRIARHPEHADWIRVNFDAEAVKEYTLSAVRENFPVQQESAWLIEGDACYWDGKSIDQGGTFTRNPNEALRFSRREDADIVKFWLLQKWSHALRTTEHVWLTDVPDSKGGK